jgi:diguanylate cyclase (GGDEF)-like protein
MTSCATVAAILLFVALGSQVLPGAFGPSRVPADSSLSIAFLLNIAIILFGWRRSKDLKEALDAYEAAERLAQRNANTDPVTGLSNRREFMQSLAEIVQSKQTGVLLSLDVDHFKRVNDLHGHLAGDELLRTVANVLTKAVPNAICCARTGGDEFAVLLDRDTSATADASAASILNGLNVPVFAEGARIQITASLGLATIERGKSEEHALRQSDVALYSAKRSGGNAYAWFDQELQRELADRLSLEEDIRTGIRQGQFVPFFQPLIDLTSGQLVGFEALARWRSPTRGLLDAESFIPSAEVVGLVGPLTLSVVEQALKEASTWPVNLKLAVNVSPMQFRDATLAEQILKLLVATGFPPRRLDVGITEAALLENREQVLAIIHSLKNVGVSISLDDFGTGYASLAQVNSLPLDRVKIDRSFITTMVKSEQTAAIVNTIASLGHQLNVPITAAGVESEAIKREIEKFGCSEAQGWLFGRPVSGATVESFLRMHEPAPAKAPQADGTDTPAIAPRVARKW